MKLIELLTAAEKGYGDALPFDPDTGKHLAGPNGDTLADFVVLEISETFEADEDGVDNRCNQIGTALACMQQAQEEIAGVIAHLEGLYL
jgi:hypothetical protein